MKKIASANRGFSLLEIMIVLVLIGILAAVARPSIKPFLEGIRLRTATNTIKQQLVLAKTRALGDPKLHAGVFFNATSGKTQAFLDTNSDNQYTAGTDPIFMPCFTLFKTDTLKIISSLNNAVVFRGDGSAKASLKLCICNGYKKCDTIKVLASTGRIQIRKNF